MSTFIPLGRIPKSREDRQLLISEQVERDERMANMGLAHVRKAVADYLLMDKGYQEDDVEIESEFSIELDEAVFTVKSDLTLRVDSRVFMLVKCAMTSPESWERYAVAMCRVACIDSIPFCLITDGEFARLVDVRTGKTVSEGFKSLPSKLEAAKILSEALSSPFACSKPEREKRILLAFEGLSCSAETKI